MTDTTTKTSRLRAELRELKADHLHHNLQITLMNKRIATLIERRTFHGRELDQVRSDMETVQQTIIDLMPEAHDD